MAPLAKLRLEESSPVEILPTQTLSQGYETVVFESCSSNRTKAACGDLLLDRLEKRGIELLQPDVLLSGRCGKVEVGVAFDSVDSRGTRASDLLLRVGLGPQPRRVALTVLSA